MSNLVNIITENGWVVSPDTNNDSKNHKAGRLFRENIAPLSQGASDIIENCWSFKLLPGVLEMTEVSESFLAIIKAPSYQMAKKDYDMDGYGIPCFINRFREITPIFREAHMSEKWIYVNPDLREDYKANAKEIEASMNHSWPKVVSLEEEFQLNNEVKYDLF